MSDSHGMEEQVTVPPGDILIHAGDCTADIGQASLRKFLKWFDGQPHVHKLLIAGNHDGAFEKWPEQARRMVVELAPSCMYLQEGAVTIDGLKLYGMPHTPAFCNWHFNVPRDKMHLHTSQIPDDTDVLITHGPPYSILDVSGFDNEHCGCEHLRDAVERIRPAVHAFGHIHHSYGSKTCHHEDGSCTHFINAAICDERYRPNNKPFVIEI